MKPTHRKRSARTHIAAAPLVARRGPHLNALKHGLRSGSVLLPGDDVAAFRALRHRLFHLYQPRTIEEAQCVETVAASHWRIARCRLEQAHFKGHLGAALGRDPDTTGYVCDPDPHVLHHRSMDCVLEETRLERAKSRAQTTLMLYQKLRTQNLSLQHSAALEDHTVFMAEGEPVVDAEPAAAHEPGPEVPQCADAGVAFSTATASPDTAFGKTGKRDSVPTARRFPKHWSRAQRRAALRREAALRRQSPSQDVQAPAQARTGG